MKPAAFERPWARDRIARKLLLPVFAADLVAEPAKFSLRVGRPNY